jgi:hypothetical protein
LLCLQGWSAIAGYETEEKIELMMETWKVVAVVVCEVLAGIVVHVFGHASL